MRFTYRIAVSFLALALQARQDWQVCGSYRERGKEEIALHRAGRRARTLTLESAAGRAARSVTRDIGQIAVIEDAEGVVSRRNPFNLDRKSLRLVPAGAGAERYRYELIDGEFDASAVQSGSSLAGLGDDDTREIALPFPFAFYGRTYTSVFINSDGNLTFNEPDTATSARSLGRMTAGPPRIAPYFADLDPSAGGSVRVLAEAGRVVVSWVSVPLYTSSGLGAANTFQVALFPDGRIQFAWQGVGGLSAVVGVAPGALAGGSEVVAFNTPSEREFSGAVAERFANEQEIDMVFTAQKFYESHEDAYDFLAVFNDLGIDAAPGALAYEVTVRSDRLGIGDPPSDYGREYGSARRLQAMLNLGPISQYPRDPAALVAARASTGDTPLTIVGHEAGHLWLAFASVREPANRETRLMLGRQSAHWSFHFNSEASLLEGNRIRDNGPGARPRFTTVATVEGYSPLDQYLMGLRPSEEVPETFVVTNPTFGSANTAPRVGVSFDGGRRDIAISEIIGTEGRRVPDHNVSQRKFRMAMILIVRAGSEPDAARLAQLEELRSRFPEFFERATGGRATMELELRRAVSLSAAPAAGLLVGRTMNATISLGRGAEEPVSFRVLTPAGVVSAPATVTVGAGSASATVALSGLRPGVEELTLEPLNASYAAAHARIQVQAGAANLILRAVSGDKQRVPAGGGVLGQPVVAQVTDANNLPYPGLTVEATATGGGSADPAVATSDEQGRVRFRWRPATDPGQLRLRLADAAGVTVTFTTSRGRPLIAADGVVNAASFTPGLVAGGFAAIFGENLAGGSVAAAGELPWPLELAGVRVIVGEEPVLVTYVSDRQINFVAPPQLLGSSTFVRVQFVQPGAADLSEPARVAIRNADPGIFYDSASGIGAILVSGTGLANAVRPARAGEVLEVYGTGFGAVVNSTVAPGLAETFLPVQAFLGGLEAEVLFSGLAPGFPGLYQVNVRVPAGVPGGLQRLALRSGSAVSNEVRVRIQ